MSQISQSKAHGSSDPHPADVPAFTVMGLSIRTTNALEMSGNEGKIGPLWQQFLHSGSNDLPGIVDKTTIYAVYTHYESDENGAYDLILGKSVHPGQQPPPGKAVISLPAAHYLVFSVAGDPPQAIQAAWKNVYGYFARQSIHHRAFTCDFEQHSGSETKIFIAIQ